MVVIICGVILVLKLIKLRNNHRALLIEKGLYRCSTPRDTQRRFYLSGIVILALGISFLVGLIPLTLMSKGIIWELVSVKLLFGGLILTFLGIGFLIFARTGFSAEELKS
jgi:hypothetical protein